MDRLPNDIDREATDGLPADELSALLIAYAQRNNELESENERLRQQVRSLTRSASARLAYIRSVRDAEAAVRRFVSDPAIAPYIPDVDTVISRLFGGPIPYGGDVT